MEGVADDVEKVVDGGVVDEDGEAAEADDACQPGDGSGTA